MADNRVWILSGPENQIGQQKERIHFKIALFAVRSSFKNIYQLKGEILPISVAFLRSKRDVAFRRKRKRSSDTDTKIPRKLGRSELKHDCISRGHKFPMESDENFSDLFVL